jgi:hypothetical protein
MQTPDERDPTPSPAPDRAAFPSGRRSPAPPPTCAGLRAQTEYYQRILDLEAAARARLAADGWPYLDPVAQQERDDEDATSMERQADPEPTIITGLWFIDEAEADRLFDVEIGVRK